MPIPNAENASIAAEKVTEYLLNPSHPVGGSKARWFIALGYDPDHPGGLADDLLDLVRRTDSFTTEESPFGVKYNVSGRMVTPSGRRVNVMTVWIFERGDSAPRLVTAYPGRRATDE
jgi:hypothetical protein